LRTYRSIQIAATPQQQAEIANLLSLPDKVVSRRRRTRLKALAELIRGASVSEIVRSSGMGSEGLRKLRHETQLKGLDAILSNLRRLLTKKSETASRPPARRGAPGATSLTATITPRYLAGEPIVTLASLILSGNAQIAVLAVQVPRSKKKHSDETPQGIAIPNHSEIFTAVLNTVRHPLTPHWTRGWVDEWIRRPFLFLPKEDDLAGSAPIKVPFIPSLRVRFRERWKYIILTSGAADAVDRVVRRLVGGQTAEKILVEGCSLVQRLESVLYSLRVQLNWRGILPTLEGLIKAATDCRAQRRAARSLSWHTNERGAISGVKRRVADFQFRAATGYLLDLTSNAQRKISVQESFSLFKIGLRPKVAVRNTLPRDEQSLDYFPFPDFSVPVWIDSKRPPDQIAQLLQKLPKASAIEYAVRLKKDQRPWIRFPDELLENKRKWKAHPEIGVVSVPRQQLFPVAHNLQIYLETLTENGRVVTSVVHDDEPALLFHSPRLMQAIWSAFVHNRYGDRLGQIEGADSWRRYLFSSPVSEDVWPHGTEAEFGRAGRLFEPAYHFSDTELQGLRVTADTRHRLHDCAVPDHAISPDGLEKRNSKCLYPGYTREQTFREMFVAFDADFLLREISGTEWRTLKADTNKWESAIHKVIRAEFFTTTNGTKTVSDGVDLPKVLRTVDFHFRRKPGQLKSLIEGWTIQALDRFERSGRILRRAIENAQALSLAGKKPVPIAVVTHSEIWQDWKGFLGQCVRGNLEAESPGTNVAIDENSLGEDNSASEQLQLRDDVRRVNDVLDRLWTHGPTEANCEVFFECLPPFMPPTAWAAPIERLKARRRKGFADIITKMLKLACKLRKKPNKAKDRIRQLLKTCRKMNRTALATRPHKRGG
jgi:hypothetical protein